ncbi:MAG TPA: transcriptional repressor [Deltaproteobacteria bacterium]|nr:transcriptional repressor [Deltaproteobacteria bacterium]
MRGIALLQMKSNFKKGPRWTAQRELILEVLREEGGHMDADELFRRAKERDPRISLSTVYRTLKLFRDLGLVKELHFGEGYHRYELARGAEHYHFLCRSCGRVLEFRSPLIQKLKEEVQKRYGVMVEGVEVRLEGYCEACILKLDSEEVRDGSDP